MTILTLSTHPKFLVTLRTPCAVVGGYAASACLSLLLAQWLGLTERPAEAFIKMVFFVVFCTLIIWSFAINSHKKAFIHMAGLNAVVWAVYLATQGVSA